MATVTPLNNWPVPTSTDLVKDGAVAIEALGDAIDASVGSGLLAWQSYTPTFTNFTLGTGTITTAKYAKLGKLVFVKLLVTLGGTSAVTGRIGISLPVTAANDNLNRAVSIAGLIAGGVTATGFAALGTTTQVDLYALVANTTYVTNSNTAFNIPGTWATGNTFSTVFTYEAA